MEEDDARKNFSPCFNTKIDDIFFSFLNVKEDKKVWN